MKTITVPLWPALAVMGILLTAAYNLGVVIASPPNGDLVMRIGTPLVAVGLPVLCVVALVTAGVLSKARVGGN